MGSGGKELGNDCGIEARLGKANSSPEACTAGTDNDRVILMVDDIEFGVEGGDGRGGGSATMV